MESSFASSSWLPPSVINGTDGWRVENLAEVWECRSELLASAPFLVYRVASGAEYVDSILKESLGVLTKVRRLYPVDTPDSRRRGH